MLPKELIWEEVALPQYKGMTRKELGLSQNELVTVKHIKKQYLGKVPHHAIKMYYNITTNSELLMYILTLLYKNTMAFL